MAPAPPVMGVRDSEAMVLRFERATMREIRIPLLRPFAIATGVTTERRVLLLRLWAEDGRSVWSECVAGESPDYSAETVDTAWLAVGDWLIPRILGRTVGRPSEVAAPLSRGIRGHRMARAAVEMAFWTLAAERRDVSLSRLLGGVRDSVPSAFTLSLAASVQELVEQARLRSREGYRRLKVKIRPGADRERLSPLREELGEELSIAADANGAYGREDTRSLECLDGFGLSTLEQPLAPGDLRRHAELQRRLRTPVGLDESVDSPERAEDMIALKSARHLNVKPGRVGGFGPSLAIHARCREAGIPLWCGGMLETGLGRAYNVALASLPGFELPGDIYPPTLYLTEDIITERWTVGADGTLAVPRGRGVGVEVDRDRVEDLTVRKRTLRV